MSIEEMQKILEDCYTRELCYPKVIDDWKIDNKTFGMCAITAMLVNDYFGGIICKTKVDGVSHYFNIIEEKIVDLTANQFGHAVDYGNYSVVERESILTGDTLSRYDILKKRLKEKALEVIDKRVNSCNACANLVDKFPAEKTVFLGSDTDLVLIGEAPANNGWRKSHMLWRDINGKMLPSGVILQKLFDIIGRDILDTTFLESVKCYPLERKNLKVCSRNCKTIMLEQLDILRPKLIITLGEFPTRNLLDFKFSKFSGVVGNIYEVGKYKVLPIYHPSPISPKSYKGNIPIFEKLKSLNEVFYERKGKDNRKIDR